MGLSRNKVAVSEGAAGSPPFYGESNLLETQQAEIERETKIATRRSYASIVVRFSGTIEKTYTYGGVAQLGEHLPCKQGVMGSNPIISTK